VIKAHRSGTLNLADLSEQDRARWQSGTIPLTIAQLSAIVDWPPVEPADLRCPTLWVVGSANENAMPSVSAYRDQLADTTVALHVLPGLTHEDELTRVDEVLPRTVAFTVGAV
jgi:hypothetical protein